MQVYSGITGATTNIRDDRLFHLDQKSKPTSSITHIYPNCEGTGGVLQPPNTLSTHKNYRQIVM